MLATTSNTVHGASVLEAVQGVNVLPTRGYTATLKGDKALRALHGNQVQACRMPVLMSAHGYNIVLLCEAKVVNLAATRNLSDALVGTGVPVCTTGTGFAVDSHLKVVATCANNARSDIAAIDSGAGYLEALTSSQRPRVDYVHTRLLRGSILVFCCLGNCDDLLIGHPHVHGQARRVVQREVLDLEPWALFLTTSQWKPSIRVQIKVLGTSICCDVCALAPARTAEESPHLFVP
jgi:hypothetical protein